MGGCGAGLTLGGRPGKPPTSGAGRRSGAGNARTRWTVPPWTARDARFPLGCLDSVLDKFVLAPDFLSSTEPLVSLKLCEALLQADARFPWVVLVPRRMGARELEHITNGDRTQLMEEIIAAGAAVRAIGAATGRPVDKLNIGSLGNITPQLHVHVVGRRPDDEAWPGPVWGHGKARPYDDKALAGALAAALTALRSMQAAA